MRKTTSFTKHEIEIAIRVLMESRIVREWVKSQAEFAGVDVSTPAGQELYERAARAQAKRLIRP